MLHNLFSFVSNGPSVLFLIFALLVVGGAVFMVSLSHVVHMVTALALTFISLAGLYILLDAEFIAFVQIMIYAGAITILTIFGIMMTRHEQEEELPRRPWHNGLLWIGCIGLFLILFYAIQKASFTGHPLKQPKDNTMAIGQMIYHQYVIPFELVSVLLTVALIGAIVLAKREED